MLHHISDLPHPLFGILLAHGERIRPVDQLGLEVAHAPCFVVATGNALGVALTQRHADC